MLPLVAIVGRPNVGKSTLFNRLVGRQIAIVADVAGVTRDRHYADAVIADRAVTVIDTGGFDPADDDALRRGIARGVLAAIDEADVVICVLDARHPATEADRQAVQLLRKSDKPAVYLANRADNPKQELLATDLFELGIEPLVAGSALHGRNMRTLERELLARLPDGTEHEIALLAREAKRDGDDGEEQEREQAPAEEEPAPNTDAPGFINIALLGRPNAGKSSLLNALSGEERSLVDDRPGTTRDPIDATVTYKHQAYHVIDTAGIRKKARVVEAIEAQSVMRALRSMNQAEVVVLLCDAVEGLADQDAKLLSLAADRGRGIVVGLNKSDLLDERGRKDALQTARDTLHFAPWAPVVLSSVKSGRGINRLMQAVRRVHGELTKRIPTSELNRFVQEVLERTPPPSNAGRVPKIFYVTQPTTAPPVFVLMCSDPKALGQSYRRFVQNQIRTAFGFESIPILVRFRARRRRER